MGTGVWVGLRAPHSNARTQQCTHSNAHTAACTHSKAHTARHAWARKARMGTQAGVWASTATGNTPRAWKGEERIVGAALIRR